MVVNAKIEPEKTLLDRQYVLADGALIAEDAYPERWDTERYFHVQSVRSGSYAERSGQISESSDNKHIQHRSQAIKEPNFTPLTFHQTRRNQSENL